MPLNPATTEFLTLKETAELLKTTTAKLRQLPIPYFRLPGCVLYARTDVEAYDNDDLVEQPLPSEVDTDAILKREELANWIRHAPKTLKHWSHRGGGPVFQSGTSKNDPPKYPLHTVCAWLSACRVD